MIGLKACPVHHEYAVVDIVDNKLDILCCCSDFKVECMKTLIRIQFFESDFKLKVVWRKPHPKPLSTSSGLRPPSPNGEGKRNEVV